MTVFVRVWTNAMVLFVIVKLGPVMRENIGERRNGREGSVERK